MTSFLEEGEQSGEARRRNRYNSSVVDNLEKIKGSNVTVHIRDPLTVRKFSWTFQDSVPAPEGSKEQICRTNTSQSFHTPASNS